VAALCFIVGLLSHFSGDDLKNEKHLRW